MPIMRSCSPSRNEGTSRHPSPGGISMIHDIRAPMQATPPEAPSPAPGSALTRSPRHPPPETPSPGRPRPPGPGPRKRSVSGKGRFLVVGCWLLASGYWLLAIGCWLLAGGQLIAHRFPCCHDAFLPLCGPRWPSVFQVLFRGPTQRSLMSRSCSPRRRCAARKQAGFLQLAGIM